MNPAEDCRLKSLERAVGVDLPVMALIVFRECSFTKYRHAALGHPGVERVVVFPVLTPHSQKRPGTKWLLAA